MNGAADEGSDDSSSDDSSSDDPSSDEDAGAEEDSDTDGKEPGATDGESSKDKKKSSDSKAQGAAGEDGKEKLAVQEEDGKLVHLPSWGPLAVFFALCAGSLFLGQFFSRAFRMQEQAWRWALVTFATLASIAITILGWPPKLGIDLSGGVILVYEIDEQVDQRAFSMEKLIAAVSKRINPDGTKEVTVRPYGERQIEIIIPNASQGELSRIESKISTSGALEFRILATRRKDASLIAEAEDSNGREVTSTLDDPGSIAEELGTQLAERMATVARQATSRLESENGTQLDVVAAWEKRDASRQKKYESDSKYVKDGSGQLVTRTSDKGEKQVLAIIEAREILARWIPVDPREADEFAGSRQHAVRMNKRDQPEVLVLMDPFNVTGAYLNYAAPGLDRRGRPAVDFGFNTAGSRLFGRLTSSNLPDPAQPNIKRQLGIVLDGALQSAPNINSPIYDRGIIEGTFTQTEVEDLSGILTAGSLPATLRKEPSSRLLTGATLGADTIAKGEASMLWSTVAVVVFMVWYYRFAGIVANLALLLNVLLILAFMIMFNAAFTLSGLAGLALTVGMAVDANVLIYERMREELARGSTLRMAIRNGFDRATTTIVDANVTTLISAVVLYVIGTDQVKGFAVTLILGIVMNLFTAITCSRIVFEAAERTRKITKLHMMQILDKSNFDFIGKRVAAVILSVVVIGIGLAGVVMRGEGLLDIDFTGGVSVEMQFEKPQDIEDIRAKVADLPDVTVQDVRISGEEPGVRFVINTSQRDPATQEPDIDKVEANLKSIFGKDLSYNHMSYTAPTLIKGQRAKSSGSSETKDKSRLDPYVDGAASTLTFASANNKPLEIDHATLEDHLAEALRTTVGDAAGVAFEIDNPAYETGSNKAFSSWNMRLAVSPQKAEGVLAAMRAQLAKEPSFPSSNKIGATVASNTKLQAGYALLASLLLIMGYVWFRFHEVSFGFAAVLAVVHDVLVALGALALSLYVAKWTSFLLVEPFKISLPIIAAFLTIIGYSLNDTIVIFDRIREIRGKSPQLSADLVNTCINQTLSRTILTSLTVFITVLIMYVFGGQGIRGFAFTLVVGVISGTYSTVYIATPVLIWLNKGDVKTGKAAGAVTAGANPGLPQARAGG